MCETSTIAILLATYNGEKYLPTQLESIINQDYSDWKVFVSDDGSTDNTLSVIKDYVARYPDKIELLEKDKPTGSAKKNFMYMVSKITDYEYIMCCDQDDFWMPNKVRVTMEKMKEIEKDNHSIPCLVHTDLEVVDGNLNTLAPSFFEFSSLNSERCVVNQLLIQNIVTGCTMMANRALLNYATRECNIDNVLMHDWWFALVAACFGKIGFVDQPTIRYRQHGNNSVGAKNSKDVSYVFAQIRKGNKNSKSIEATMVQAKEFVDVFREELDEKDYKLINGYANLVGTGKGNSISYMIRNRIWKNGITRKIAQVIFI